MVFLALLAIVVWAVWTVRSFEPSYEVQGSHLLSGVDVASPVPAEPGTHDGDTPSTTETLASRLVQDARAAPRETWAPSSVAFDVSPAAGGLLRIHVQAPTPAQADAVLDEVLVRAREAVDQGSVVAVFFRTAPSSSPDPGDDQAASASALVGVPKETDLVLGRLRPRPDYLIRVASVLLDEPDRRSVMGLAPDQEIVVDQTPFDSAPVVNLTVTGASPAAARASYARVSEELGVIVDEIQVELGVHDSLTTTLVSLNVPGDAVLRGESVIGDFYRATGIVAGLVVLSAWWLHRVAQTAAAARRGGEPPSPSDGAATSSVLSPDDTGGTVLVDGQPRPAETVGSGMP